MPNDISRSPMRPPGVASRRHQHFILRGVLNLAVSERRHIVTKNHILPASLGVTKGPGRGPRTCGVMLYAWKLPKTSGRSPEDTDALQLVIALDLIGSRFNLEVKFEAALHVQSELITE